jgi:hypothetical protein
VNQRGDDIYVVPGTGCIPLRPACAGPHGQKIIRTAFGILSSIEETADCRSPASGQRTPPSGQAIRAEVTKLAPTPHAHTGGTDYLTNTAIVTYTDPDLAHPNIGPFPLLGHTITAHLTLTTTTWHWHDPQHPDTTTTTNPTGTPYHPNHPCTNNTSCPGYISHVYPTPGPHTISITANWTATYTIDNGPPQPLPGTLTTTNPTGHTITTHNAHSTLTTP